MIKIDNLDFRKFLTTYGISYEEYNNMDESKKQELTNRFNEAEQMQKQQMQTEGLKAIGNGLQGCGCLIMLIPALIMLLYFMFAIATS